MQCYHKTPNCRHRIFILSTLCLLLLQISVVAQTNWPRFRGSDANGIGDTSLNFPMKWDKNTNVRWKTDLPGLGWSCPIIWEDKVFLTAVTSDEENTQPKAGLYLGRGVRDPGKGVHHWRVFCYDLNTGKKLWDDEPHTGVPIVPRHPKSTYAAETPTTDGQRLYVLFGDLGLYCYSLEGEFLWSQAIDPKKTFYDYGAASSPVVHGNQVFVVYDNLEESWIASFNTETGKQNWKVPRDEKRSWATPFVWEHDLRTELVVPGLNKNRSYSLEGNVIWEFDGEMSGLVIPSPFAAHGMCYISSGYFGDAHRPTYAIKPGAQGDITPKKRRAFSDNKFIEWYQGTSGPYNTSQIIYGDYLYTLYDMGFLTCHNALTGEEIYEKQRFSPRGSFTSSPWAYNGHIFCLSENGVTYVVKAGPEFEVVAKNDLDELCISTPGLAKGKLLIRTASSIYCLENNENAKTSFDSIKEKIEAKVQSGKVSGAGYVVYQDSQKIYSHYSGYIDIEKKQPIQNDSLVRIYSMSKPITSVAAMQLYEKGAFDLDDPISKFIPAFEQTKAMEQINGEWNVVPLKKPITVKHVLTHTAGYSYTGGNIPSLKKKYTEAGMNYHGPAEMYPPQMTIEQAAIALASIPTHHQPGEKFTYGYCTDLLGRLIEVWSGQALDIYMKENVFIPLGMNDTDFKVGEANRSRFASCHTMVDGKLVILEKSETSPFINGFEFLSGGGGLISSLEDYSKFCQALVYGGEFNGKRILKEETLDLMFQDHLNGVAGDFQFGLGFAIGTETLGTENHSVKKPRYSWGGYASTSFHVLPEINMFQIFFRQFIPTSSNLAEESFQLLYQNFETNKIGNE